MSKTSNTPKPLDLSEGETRNGSRSWAMSLKPQYIKAIKRGVKRYEVRTRVPGYLRPGDRIYVVQTASGGKVVLFVVVDAILIFSSMGAWGRFRWALGINKLEYDKYTLGRARILLIRFRDVEKVPKGMTIHDLGLKKAPQWFSRIK